MSTSLTETTKELQRTAWLTALAGAVLSLIGFFLDRKAFAGSYLTAYLVWSGVTLGSLGVLFIHSLTGGNWGKPIRPVLEKVIRLIPLLVVLFLPVILTMKELYIWTDAERVAHDEILAHKAMYLNTRFFLIRTAGFFVIWFALAAFYLRGSRKLAGKDNPRLEGRLQGLAGVGLLIYTLSASFASIDWVMSLEPHWFSTIYGLIFVVGQGLSCFAFALILLAVLHRGRKQEDIMTHAQSHDLGNLLFAFMLLWAYLALSQFLIMWSGNLPEETPWYLKRVGGGWHVVALMLVAFHFTAPFFLLLMRGLKRSFKSLAWIAGLLFFMRWFDLAWFVKPAMSETLSFHWMDITCFLAVGGLWLGFLLRLMSRSPEESES